MADGDEIEVIDLPSPDGNEEMEALLQTVDDLEEEVNELTAEVERLKVEVEAKDKETAAVRAELASKTEQVEDLHKKLSDAEEREKRALVERFLDLKVRAGRVAASERDGLVDEYMKRTVDSIRDGIADLAAEVALVNVPTDVPHFEAFARGGEKNVVTSGAQEKSPRQSLEEMLSWLLNGRKRR